MFIFRKTQYHILVFFQIDILIPLYPNKNPVNYFMDIRNKIIKFIWNSNRPRLTDIVEGEQSQVTYATYPT